MVRQNAAWSLKPTRVGLKRLTEDNNFGFRRSLSQFQLLQTDNTVTMKTSNTDTIRFLALSLLTTVVSANYESQYNGVGIANLPRLPTWEDWEYLRDYWSDRIDDSTCPDAGSEELKTHWDYNYDDHIAAGMTESEALQQDCELYHRERNPRSMGSRLVRHAFHDAAGGFDGFVNVSVTKLSPCH